MRMLPSILSAAFVISAPITAVAATIPFVVDAQVNSTTGGVFLDTGIDLFAGDSLTVTVDPTDCWSAGAADRTTNADGLVGNTTNACRPVAPSNYGLHPQFGQSFPFASLVGRLGLAGVPFLIGTSFDGIVPTDGRLYLAFWDSNAFDNSGSITAQVTVPEPATLVLLGAGLLALRRRVRRGAVAS